MKIFIIVLVCFAVSLVISKKGGGNAIHKTCSNGTVTNNDVQAFFSGSENPGPKLQKYFVCVFAVRGVITKDEFKIDVYKQFAQGRKDQVAANELLVNCKKAAENEKDKDQQAGIVAKCVRDLRRLEEAPNKRKKQDNQ